MVPEDEIADDPARALVAGAGRRGAGPAGQRGRRAGQHHGRPLRLELEEEAEEEDTLSGAEATAVGEAVAAAPTGDETPDDGTMVMSAAEAKAARQAEADRRTLRRRVGARPLPPRRRPKGPVTGGRRVPLWAFGLLLVVALLVGL